jgi:GntR family transcriptional repressor for pyruvate dehydrogenase complex
MQPFEFRAVDRQKLYASIVDQIVEGIRAGLFPPGRALPPERMLAERLRVSRSSLREAIRVLEHAGVLDVRTGSGTYVSENGASSAAALRAHAASVGEHSPLDVVVARRSIEPVCAELAAIHRQQRDIDVMRENLRLHAERLAGNEDPEEVDHAFHLVVAATSHNPVLAVLLEHVVNIMRQGTWRDLKHRTWARPGRAEAYLEQHRKILVAVEGYDAAGARAAMHEHLEAVEKGLLAEVD